MEKVDTFKNRLEKALDLRELKAVDIAKRTGIRESTISQYRSGYTEPKIGNLEKIAKALSVNNLWLSGYDVPMDDEQILSITQTFTTDEEILKYHAYCEAIAELPDNLKEMIYKYIDVIYENYKGDIENHLKKLSETLSHSEKAS